MWAECAGCRVVTNVAALQYRTPAGTTEHTSLVCLRHRRDMRKALAELGCTEVTAVCFPRPADA